MRFFRGSVDFLSAFSNEIQVKVQEFFDLKEVDFYARDILIACWEKIVNLKKLCLTVLNKHYFLLIIILTHENHLNFI